jgi:hypothetical protein
VGGIGVSVSVGVTGMGVSVGGTGVGVSVGKRGVGVSVGRTGVLVVAGEAQPTNNRINKIDPFHNLTIFFSCMNNPPFIISSNHSSSLTPPPHTTYYNYLGGFAIPSRSICQIDLQQKSSTQREFSVVCHRKYCGIMANCRI